MSDIDKNELSKLTDEVLENWYLEDEYLEDEYWEDEGVDEEAVNPLIESAKVVKSKLESGEYTPEESLTKIEQLIKSLESYTSTHSNNYGVSPLMTGVTWSSFQYNAGYQAEAGSYPVKYINMPGVTGVTGPSGPLPPPFERLDEDRPITVVIEGVPETE